MSTLWTFRPGRATFRINQSDACGRITSHFAFYGGVMVTSKLQMDFPA